MLPALLFAQGGSRMTFQTQIKTNKNQLYKNRDVKIIAQLTVGLNGPVIWRETKTLLTDEYGMLAIELGDTPNQVTGPTSLENLDWSKNNIWLTVFQNSLTGRVLLQTAPQPEVYALYANKADYDARIAFQPGNGLKYSKIYPTGAVISFAGPKDKIPSGWIVCEGQELTTGTNDPKSGISYDSLFAVIGTKFGSSAAGKFHVPDLRGRFIRGHSADTDRDPDRDSRFALYPNGATGNQIGSYQEDAIGQHRHQATLQYHQFSYNRTRDIPAGTPNGMNTFYPEQGTSSPYTTEAFANSQADASGKESRPQNVYVYYIIKL